ncbi:MAG: hypothetical protein GC136_08360 [Alphaproteobacteria bacterium]|nr:hypothetical protein [Alphaproteobacteria bacterium]
MRRDFLQIFNQFGLKEKEARVYMACLPHTGGLHTHEITTLTKISRSTVDVTVERLLERRFLRRVKSGARYKFFAEVPDTILQRQQKTMDDFAELAPFLLKGSGDFAATEILSFEGKQGLQKAYDDIFLRLKHTQTKEKELIEFTNGVGVLALYPDIEQQFVKKRIAMKVSYRGIAPTSANKVKTFDNKKEGLREIKFIDDTLFPFKSVISIYVDSVMIFSPHKPVGGCVIRNPHIADSLRALFNLVWSGR